MEDLNHQLDELQVQPAPAKANLSTLAASLPAEELLHGTAAQLQGEAASSGPAQLDSVGQQPLQRPRPPPQALQPPLPADMQALLDIVERWPADGLQEDQIEELMRACTEHLRGGGGGGMCQWVEFGELQYERSLGNGSFGMVCLYAWGQQRRVAIKWLNLLPTFNSREQVSAAKSFVREVLHLAQLEHPHIVELHGLTWDPKQGLGIVLEYVQQGALSTVLGPKVTPQQRLAWAMHVADAMQYLHTRGPPVVHRDLKSDNILIDEAGNAKLADFGVSLELHQTYLPINTNPGTVGWAAPEAVRAAYKTRGPRVLSTCTKECDVYSYGLLLGVLATGKDPWEGWCGWDVMLAVHQGCRLRPPEGLQQPGVHDLIGRCLDEQPTNRPGFGAVLEALSLLQPQGIIPSGTWPDPVPGAMQLPAARPPARARGETASMSQAEGQGGGRQLPPAPLQARSSAEPSQLAGQQHPTAPSTPQPTQPHAPIGGSAPGSSITGFMQSLLDAVGRWPERLQGAPYMDLLEACMLKMREKFDGFWIEPEQLKLGRVVGGGAFAVVLQAEKAPEGRQVALKQFHVFRDSYERTHLESFIKEVCLLSQLKHQNIVALHHFTANLQAGWLGIVLEWAGDPLAIKLAAEKGGRLVITPQELLEWAIGVAEGLEYLHGHDPCVVHRGLTSMDVMINQHSQAKLIDLGISQVLTHTHLTVNQACSLSWSAPELLSGGLKAKGLQLFGLVNEKYDIYSFGLCLGVMATHSGPWEEFEADTYQVVAGFHQGARLEPPQVQQPWLQELIQQCMREEPDSRPAIGDVLHVLRQHSEEGIVRSPAAWPVRWPPDS